MVLAVPKQFVETISRFRLPKKSDRRLGVLMGRNNEGPLTKDGQLELESLVELSESLSLVRAQALRLLGRRPK